VTVERLVAQLQAIGISISNPTFATGPWFREFCVR